VQISQYTQIFWLFSEKMNLCLSSVVGEEALWVEILARQMHVCI
jgi:hypothetical protein